MIEVRWHGRGGQGAVTSVEILAVAAIEEGKYAQGFPSFGPERRGAPVAAFNRVDNKQIKIRSGIYHPDAVVVLDEGLVGLVNVAEGLKPDGVLIVNTSKTAKELQKAIGFKGRIATVDATAIAREELDVPITNTTMLGALIKAIGIVKMDSLKSPIAHRFGRLAQKNLTAAQRAYNEIRLSA
ncbi:MAG: pyruvate synthase [Syntrophobacterales bacterium CG_4_8_14_3_um_filter_49_14]|nr:MAG: pyruvate synthase [Syntrophobacterales bacterium CG23_combo_of_CG06-09_8_20_14_all_48_27]PJC73009.1 MAG: pyruvate synthase [Syntrophobacterales bacterium CG_4_8_14_3_um_filter_49_14]